MRITTRQKELASGERIADMDDSPARSGITGFVRDEVCLAALVLLLVDIVILPTGIRELTPEYSKSKQSFGIFVVWILGLFRISRFYFRIFQLVGGSVSLSLLDPPYNNLPIEIKSLFLFQPFHDDIKNLHPFLSADLSAVFQ